MQVQSPKKGSHFFRTGQFLELTLVVMDTICTKHTRSRKQKPVSEENPVTIVVMFPLFIELSRSSKI